jgi:L-threonylcarbamoyladenylate synthase
VTSDDARAFQDCVAGGGVALFPADTVYGLAAQADDEAAIRRLYEIKGRDAGKPAAVMYFSLERALAARDLGPRTRAAVERLLPGAVTLVLPGGSIRVPRLDGPLAPLSSVTAPVVQSSANPAGGPDPRRLEDVDPGLRARVDLELDGGELPGIPSTVVDLRGYEDGGGHSVLREGAISAAAVAALL